MPEPTDDGWPKKYRDPRDRPQPSVLRVTVESFEGIREETRNAIETVSEGDEQPAIVSFATVGELRTILTDRRIELLRTLLAIGGAAESISVLADDLDRDYRAVHNDVSLLVDHGLLFVVEESRSKRPYLPYERIHLDVELVGGTPAKSTL
jgi:predicted transcriptional regulator